MAKWSVAAKSTLLALVIGIAALMLLPAGSVLGAASISGTAAAASIDNAAAPTPVATAHPTTTVAPLSPTTPPGGSPFLSHVPAQLEKAPWIASLTHTGPATLPLASLPNLGLLEHAYGPTPQGAIDMFYVSQPAPLGLADYGLGVTPYSYNTSHIMGAVTFNTPPNVTDPGSTGLISPAGQHDGYVGNVYEFGIQLNTIATNMSIPGSDQGFFWTQNVVNFNDTGIHFVDDTFNSSGNPSIAANTIYSACDNGSAGVNRILAAYGGVFQCVGGTVPISPASYPITVQLYNNASINKDNRTVVTYGYRFILAGTGQVYTGVASDVVFNNPNAATSRPANTPGFSVDGMAYTPGGQLRDAEIDLVGDIGGDLSSFRSINGTINLEYSNRSAGGWQAVPSAYNFGGDTGETSDGIADYWTPSHTLVFNQGPAMLYGLWNAIPYLSVPSGSIHISGSITPSYGFVFVSNTPPVLDPWNATLGERDNMSWLPTTDAGTFSTYLPPTVSPWTTSYSVEAFAAGYANLNGPAITGSVSGYSLKLTAAPGTLNAPLYAFSNAQESALAKVVTGSGAPPYVYNGLTVNMNLSFEHVDDYGYPEFVVFMAQDVTNPIQISNVYQGEDSPAGNFVITDYGSTFYGGILTPAPAFYELAYYTSGINIYGGAHDQVSDQILAEEGYNLQLVLWGDRDLQVWDINSVYGSQGVFVGESIGSQIWDVTASEGATGVSDLGSTNTHVWDVGAVGVGSTGVFAVGSTGDRLSDLEALDGATGVVTGAFDNAATAFYPYYWLDGTTDLSIVDLLADKGSLGANVSLSVGTTVRGVAAVASSVGLLFWHSEAIAVSDVAASERSVGVAVFDSQDIGVTQVDVLDGSVAVVAVHSSVLRITHVTDRRNSIGVELVDSSWATVEDLTAEKNSVGVVLEDATHITLEHIHAYDHSVAVEVV